MKKPQRRPGAEVFQAVPVIYRPALSRTAGCFKERQKKGAGPSGTFPPKSFPEGPTQAGVRRPALWDRVTNQGWRPELSVPHFTSDSRSFDPPQVVVTTLRADRNDRHFVAPRNRVAVFRAVTASAHINEPLHAWLRGSQKNPRSFPTSAESRQASSPVPLLPNPNPPQQAAPPRREPVRANRRGEVRRESRRLERLHPRPGRPQDAVRTSPARPPTSGQDLSGT
jgi:hypothetical protein